MRLVVKPPNKDDKGFLRRSRQAIGFSQKLKDNPAIETIDEMVEFILQYVTTPKDRDKAKEGLLDASENEFLEILKSIGGGDREGDSNPTNSDGKKSKD
jgi:hypothetical protein